MITPTLALGLSALLQGLPANAVLPVTSVRSGQQGVCHTVFAGHQVEDVPFEVRGVMQNYLGPKRHVIVVRLGGDKAEFTNVAKGMSGSPCEIDGRLVGVIAYGFASFSKEPVTGLTPIEDMLELLRLPSPKLPWRQPDPAVQRSGSAPVSAQVAGPRAPWPPLAHQALWAPLLAAGRGSAAAPAAAAANVVGAGPLHAQGEGLTWLATPLSVAGLSAQALAPWQAFWTAQGFAPQLAGGAAAAATATPGGSRALVPGGSVAAVMVRGDVSLAATGTVSYVEGDRVLAFGHPFMGRGPVSFPMAQAEIVQIMASAQQSFKMAVTGATVGEVQQDRLTAIAGTLGARAKMLPVQGFVAAHGQRHAFQFEVVRDAQLTPPLLGMALAGALSNRVEASERGTARLKATLHLQDLAPIVYEDVLAERDVGAMLAHLGLETAAAFDLLWNPPDQSTPGDAALTLEVTLDETPVVETVASLRVEDAATEPGGNVTVAVELWRPDAPPAIERVLVTVPPHLHEEPLTLVAASGPAGDALLYEMTGAPRPHSRAEVADVLRQRRPGGALYVLALRKRPGLQVRGQALAALPPSAAALFGGAQPPHLAEYSLVGAWSRPRLGSVHGLAKTEVYVQGP